MRTFDVQSTGRPAGGRLPVPVRSQYAPRMDALRVDASEEHGTVDWTMTFPSGVVAKAHSRVAPHRGKSIYTFVLEAPSAPPEELEGALDEQSRVLADELSRLATRLATRGQGQPA